MRDILAAIWERLTKELSESSPLDLLAKVLAAFLLILLAYAAKKLWSWIRPRFKTWWLTKRRLLARIASLESRLNRGLGAVARASHGSHVSEGKGVWLTEPINPPWSDEQYRLKLIDSIPIWVLANNKGGVAKTTRAMYRALAAAIERVAGHDRAGK